MPEEDIQAALAINSGSFSAAELLGPAIGTALFVGVGAGWAYALDAATFLVSAAFLLRVRARRRGAEPSRSIAAGRPARRLSARCARAPGCG